MYLRILVLGGVLLLGRAHAADQLVYVDSLGAGWQDWSWAAITQETTPVHEGNRSLGVVTDGWEALYLHHDAQAGVTFSGLEFWIHGGSAGGQVVQVQATSGGNPQTAVSLPALKANQWEKVSLTFAALGVAGDASFDGFWIQSRTASTQAKFFVDDIVLKAGVAEPPGTNAAVVLEVDAARNRKAINPLIYGLAFASTEALVDLNVPLNRSGGNAESRYNWRINAHNRGADWYFESLADEPAVQGAEADEFVMASRSAGAEPMLTVPMLGWVPKLGPNRQRLASFSIAKYGAQTGRDAQWFPDAGNGISAANNQPITTNDPNDANSPVDSVFQQDWVRHLINRWGTSGTTGVRYYFLDNEPTLWHATHRDIWKTGVRMQEYRDRYLEYARRVKDVDAGAVILGPEEWGWSGYLYSGYDQQWGSQNGWGNLPDRAANGGMDFMPWLLDQLKKEETSSGRKLLDVFTLHYYPQGGEFGNETSAAMQARRNRSTRSLWDPNYTDESWIASKVRLIPRMKQWVAQYYPGLQTGITEYNWGAENHINGATAQADILGIFGREGLELANRWTTPPAGSPVYHAIKLYRNYDGKKSTFGETSVYARAPEPDRIAIFAAQRSRDGVLTAMVINKIAGETPVTLNLGNFAAQSAARVWRLTSANQIIRIADVPIQSGSISNTVPGQSITLFVIPVSLGHVMRITSPRILDGAFHFRVEGVPGTNYELQRASALGSWETLGTYQLGLEFATHQIPLVGISGFVRAVLR